MTRHSVDIVSSRVEAGELPGVGTKSAQMLSSFRKFDCRTNPPLARRIFQCSLLSAFLLLLAGFLSGNAFAGQEARIPRASQAASGPQLAISDFDGDFHPDLASVEAGTTISGNTDYWIQLQLSAAGPQSIRLVAPSGGLQIEARDVNGDHAVDLVLTTTSLRQPVAIFLNDGHGSFSRVASSDFPEAFSKSPTNWASACDQSTDAVGIPPQSRTSVCLSANAHSSVPLPADSIPPSRTGILFDFFVVSHAGRAPPALPLRT